MPLTTRPAIIEMMFRTRLIMSIVGTMFQEAVIVAIWLWGLPYLDVHLSIWALVLVMIGWGIYSAIAFMIGTKALTRKQVIGLPMMVGGMGKAISNLAPEGQVKVKGEIWGAHTVEGNIDSGEEIEVVGQEGLKLYVRRTGLA
jgi:membrane-bound ClpP family serine protease